MKHRLLLLFLAFAGFLSLVAPPPARADDEVSFAYFHDTLAQYGDWIQVDQYGLCWQPSNVDANWAPYTDGYWAYTDAGWTWVSYEDFGAIVYHYGRWMNVDGTGWVWVPDYTWGPSWVSWRNNDDYVGWAPLPPEAHFQADVGVSTWVDTSYDIGPGYYHFCAVRDFGAPSLVDVILPRTRNMVIISNTYNVTNITVGNAGLPFVGGPSFEFISGRSERPIPALKLVQVNNVTNINVTNINNSTRTGIIGGVRNGNSLLMPVLKVRPPDPAQLQAYKPVRTIAKANRTHGWEGVPPAEATKLRATYTQQDKGATPATAKAKPFNPALIAKVPAKADEKAIEASKRPGGMKEAAAQDPARTTAREGAGKNVPLAKPNTIPGEPKPAEGVNPPGVAGGLKGPKTAPRNEAVVPPTAPGAAEGGFHKKAPAPNTPAEPAAVVPGEPEGGFHKKAAPGAEEAAPVKGNKMRPESLPPAAQPGVTEPQREIEPRKKAEPAPGLEAPRPKVEGETPRPKVEGEVPRPKVEGETPRPKLEGETPRPKVEGGAVPRPKVEGEVPRAGVPGEKKEMKEERPREPGVQAPVKPGPAAATNPAAKPKKKEDEKDKKKGDQ